MTKQCRRSNVEKRDLRFAVIRHSSFVIRHCPEKATPGRTATCEVHTTPRHPARGVSRHETNLETKMVLAVGRDSCRDRDRALDARDLGARLRESQTE